MQRARGARALVAAAAPPRRAARPAGAGAGGAAGPPGGARRPPPPPGADITGLAFAGPTGYAVGDFGTLLRSTDAGATWSGLPSTTVQDLTRIGIVGPAGFVTSGGCAVRRSTDTGTTLSAIDVGGGDTGCGTRVLATAFPDPSNGLILFESGVVLGTADGGVSLSRRTPVPGSPTDLAGVSATTAFATSGNAVHRTVDAGGSWTLVGQNLAGTPPTPRLLHALTFASASVGYAAGDSGTVLKTTDGGATWLPAASPGPDLSLTGVRCADADLCLFTTSGGTIVRTPDGGATYAQVTASASPIRAIAFASATRVVAAGDGGVTVLSDDGGVTWRTTSGAITGPATSIAAGAGGFAYAVGPTAISLTSDGGDTWRSAGIPTPRAITVAAFADPVTGYVQDDGGTLRRTLNGGTSWQILDPGPAAGPLQGILTLSPTRLLLITRAGVARSVDGGDTVALLSSPVLRRSKVIRGGVLAAAGRGPRAYIAGRAGLLVTTNGGTTWKAARLPRVGGRAPANPRADCIPPGGCWVLTTRTRLYRLVGARWREVTPSVGVPLRNVVAIAATGPGEAFLALARTPTSADQHGVVLATRDGGTSWAPQLLGRDAVSRLDAVKGRAWALTGSGEILTTTTAGRTAVPSVLTISPSRRAVKARQTVRVTGRLKRAQGGEQVTLYVTGAAPRALTVASSGSFSTTLRITRTTTLVAQWAGDGVRSGDGTPPVVVRLRR